MNDKILLSEEISEIVYEPHINRADKLPFIFHIDDIRCRAMANLHENIELLYILEGTGQVLLGDKSAAARPGRIIAVNSFVAHSVFPKTRLRYACLIVDTRFFLENGIRVDTLRLHESIDDGEAAASFSEIIEEYAHAADFAEAGIRAPCFAFSSVSAAITPRRARAVPTPMRRASVRFAPRSNSSKAIFPRTSHSMRWQKARG